MKNRQYIIFVVDDNEASLTACKQILKPFYVVYPLPSALKMFDLLEHVTPDMILLDVEMSDMNGHEAIKILKEKEKYRDLPVIFLSAKNDAESEIEGLKLGAMDYIEKPFVSTLLLNRIGLHLSQAEYRVKLSEIKTCLSGTGEDAEQILAKIKSILE